MGCKASKLNNIDGVLPPEPLVRGANQSEKNDYGIHDTSVFPSVRGRGGDTGAEALNVDDLANYTGRLHDDKLTPRQRAIATSKHDSRGSFDDSHDEG